MATQKNFWYLLVAIFKIASVHPYYFYMGVPLGYFKRGLAYQDLQSLVVKQHTYNCIVQRFMVKYNRFSLQYKLSYS